MTYITMPWLRRAGGVNSGVRPSALGAASKAPISRRWQLNNECAFPPEGLFYALPSHRADIAGVSDRDLPVVRDRQVEAHRRCRWPSRHRRRLHGVSARLAADVNRERHGVWPLVTDLNLNHVRSWRHRLIDQRACGGQDRQHQAEGDGPQHDAIVASGRKVIGGRLDIVPAAPAPAGGSERDAEGTSRIELQIEVVTRDHLVPVARDRPRPLKWDIEGHVRSRRTLEPRRWLDRAREHASSGCRDGELYWVRLHVAHASVDRASPRRGRWLD